MFRGGIDEAGSRKAKGSQSAGNDRLGGRAMGISKEVRTKIPHDWKSPIMGETNSI